MIYECFRHRGKGSLNRGSVVWGGGGEEAGIDIGIQVMRLLWQQNTFEEDWVLILIYVHNALMSRIGWPSCEKSNIIGPVERGLILTATATGPFWWCTTRGGAGHFFHRKEGATQGYPLATISSVIGILPLICKLHGVHPPVHSALVCGLHGSGRQLPRFEVPY